MKAVLALAVLAVFAAVADSSVIPSNVNSDSPVVPPNDNSDSSDVPSPHIIEYYDVVDLSSDLPHVFSTEPSRVIYSSKSGNFSSLTAASQSSRNNLFVGAIGPRDRQLDWSLINLPAVWGATQRWIVEFRRTPPAVINAIRAFQVRVFNQGSSVWISSGRVGTSSVTLTFQSSPGGPIHYEADSWGL